MVNAAACRVAARGFVPRPRYSGFKKILAIKDSVLWGGSVIERPQTKEGTTFPVNTKHLYNI